MTYPQAQAEATRLARESNENCYIAECECYARSEDEYGAGPYITGIRAVFDIMYDKLSLVGGRVVGVVDPQGGHFCNDLNLALAELTAARPAVRTYRRFTRPASGRPA